jgi:rhamnose transport system permease protein
VTATGALAALLRRTVARWEALLVLLVVAAGAWSTSLSPFFLDWANLLDLTTPFIFVGLMALGLTFVVIAGEIDISVASILAVSVVICARLWQGGLHIWVACAIGLAVATGLGLVNGLLVGVLHLPSLAVTLGTLAAFRGLAFVVLGGAGATGFPLGFSELGIGYVGSSIVPISLVILLACGLALAVLLHATRFGRYLYAIGSNREAARFSGIPVDRVRVALFVLSGFMAGVAGVVFIGFFGSARADAANNALLDVVTAVVLGGVNIFGGSGTIVGVLLALLLIATLRNGMGLANISSDTQSIVIGGLLLAAILAGNLAQALRERRRGGPQRRGLFGRGRKGVLESQAAPASSPVETEVGS